MTPSSMMAGGRAPSAEIVRPSGAISSLAPDTRRPACVRIHVGGHPYYTIPKSVALAERLAAGRVIDEALHERLGRAADQEAAFRAALRALELRPYAHADLARRLVRRGHAREAVTAALDEVSGMGLLDDAAFARTYVETRTARGRGPVRIRRDLMSMGVAREAADAAIAAQWPDGTEDPALPLELATRRAAQLGDLPRPVKRRRLLAYLMRRGFSGRTVNQVVTRVLGA
ncbi:MAG TPA: regulatory protein RecX [Gemmatimonadales bacterium]|nr:regulatory protein RecX [Gemmatimonadales bacterium]